MPLVSAPHLARSYHHLFPPPNTIPHIPDDIPEDERDQTERELFNLIQPCIGCGETANSIEEGKQFVYCELCRSSLCQDWIRTIMIRVILAPNDLLTPFDLRAQNFRVNVEFST